MVLTQNMPYYTVRIKFKKVGSLQYISHLDLVRTMNKIIVRANLPLWYTEGFNPKPKMIFAAPLSIGVESLSEYMDVRLTEKVSPEVIKMRLNSNMTDEMQVLDAYYTDVKLTELKWLSYSIDIKTERADEELVNRIREVLSRDSIVVKKKGKPHEEAKEQDIARLIKSSKVALNGDVIHIDCILSADASEFLNPEYIIKALKAECGILSCSDLKKEHYSILRTEGYKADMSLFGAH